MNRFLFIFILLASSLAISGCHQKKISEKPVVCVTIAPYAAFAELLVENLATVETIVPPNANLHLYEPTPKQIDKIQKAVAWIRLGEQFEEKAISFLLEKKSHPTLLNLSEHTRLIYPEISCSHKGHTHHTKCADLHYWLSPKEAMQHIKAMKNLFCTLWPNEQTLIEQRAQKLLQELEILDQEIAATLAKKKDTCLLVAHAAFTYFCRDYDLHQVSIEHEGKDPLPRHLIEIIHTAKRENPSFVLTQVQYNQKSAQWVAEEMSIPLKQVDPYAKNYFQNMRNIAQTIGN